MAQDRLEPAGRLDQAGQVKTCFIAGPLKHPDDIFGRDISGCCRCKRAAPYPTATGIDHLDTSLHSSENIREARSSGIVEMHPETDIRGFDTHTLDPLADIERRRRTDRVPERQFTDAGSLCKGSQPTDARQLYLTGIRIPERDRNCCRQENARLMNKGGTPGEHLGALGGAHALVTPTESLAGHKHKVYLIRLRLDRAANTGFVQGKGNVTRSSRTPETGENGRGIGHLRYGARAHETAGFDPPYPDRLKPGNKFQLLRNGQVGGIILEAVARADFNDFYKSWHPITLARDNNNDKAARLTWAKSCDTPPS